MTGDTFDTQSEFREYLFKHVYPSSHNPNWKAELPDEVNGPQQEAEAEAALRKRMADVWKEVSELSRKQQEAVNEGSVRPIVQKPSSSAKHAHALAKRTRATPEEMMAHMKDFHIEMIVKMMAALSQEHELLYQLVAHPLVQFLCATLPPDKCESHFAVRSRCSACALQRRARTQGEGQLCCVVPDLFFSKYACQCRIPHPVRCAVSLFAPGTSSKVIHTCWLRAVGLASAGRSFASGCPRHIHHQ